MLVRSWLLPFVLALFTDAAYAESRSPSVFWASDPVSGNEAVLLVGDGLDPATKVDVMRVSDQAAGEPDDQEWVRSRVEVAPMQATGDSLKFIVPERVAGGVVAVRVTNRIGKTVAFLNRPEPYWIQGDGGTKSSPGGWLRVFGRSIGVAGAHARLELAHTLTGVRRTVGARKSSTWDAQFELPRDFPEGAYSTRITNGRGGELGWVNAGRIDVSKPAVLPQRTFDVRRFGARANGTEDDLPALVGAITAAAANGGGVVALPRGRYRLSGPLTIPPRVTLRGEARERVALLWDDLKVPPPALIKGTSDFAITDATLYASNYSNFLTADMGGDGAGHVRLERLTIRATRYRGHLKAEEVDGVFRQTQKLADWGDTIALGGRNLVVTDCDIYGSGRSIYLFKPRGALIARNRFFNGRLGWYSISGADGVIFEDNEVVGGDLMSSGGGVNNLGGARASQNVWFARNRLSLFHGWDREAFTSDAGGGFYYGPVADAGTAQFRMIDEPNTALGKPDTWSGAGVFILGGTGAGQWAQVREVQGQAVVLDRPWRVPPDDTSVVTVTPMQRNYLVVGNTIEDAGVAIQFYGTSLNHVIAENKATRAGPMLNLGMWYRHYQPSWYLQFIDNEFVDGNIYRGGSNNGIFSGEAFIGTFGVPRAPNQAPLARASVIRRNKLRANAHIEVLGRDPKTPGLKDVVIEGNSIANAAVGLKIDSGVIGLLARRNTFLDVDVPIQDASPVGVNRIEP